MNVVIVYGHKNACYHYRVEQPYTKIKSDINFVLCQQLNESGFETTDGIDAVVLQRPCDKNLLRFIKDFQAEGGICIVETDDDMNNIPYSNPVHPFVRSDNAIIYNECIREAKYVHVSTPELMVGKKSTVFYNAIDLSKYTNPLPKKENSVIWTGSNTHADSLEIIKPVIQELLYDEVNVILMGAKEGWIETIFKPHKNLIILPPIEFEQFYRIPSMAMINLAPLQDNKFNRAKSELRILESAAWRVPTVASAVNPYTRFARLSRGGTLIVKKERSKEWLKTIYSLLQNKELYESCAEKSYLCLQQNYSLEKINQQRAVWWSNMLKHDRRKIIGA